MPGEYGRSPSRFRPSQGTPPLARGILEYKLHRISVFRNTPACAGNTYLPERKWNVRREHPRLHGEYFVAPTENPAPCGTPPLARGILHHPARTMPRPGNTPACAGNTGIRSEVSWVLKEHPRLRGEYHERQKMGCPKRGTPPLVRGILLQASCFKDVERNTPACPGNTGGA